MKTETPVTFIPRSIVLPVVLAFCSLTLLLSGSTLIVRPWFVHSFDWLDANGVGHADIDVLFRQTGALVAVLLIAAPGLVGGWLLRRSDARPTHVVWFGVLSLVALGVWTVWVGLVLHNTYIALFTH